MKNREYYDINNLEAVIGDSVTCIYYKKNNLSIKTMMLVGIIRTSTREESFDKIEKWLDKEYNEEELKYLYLLDRYEEEYE